MRFTTAAVVLALIASACVGVPRGIEYQGDTEATKIFEFCAGESSNTVQVRYGGPPRLVNSTKAVVAPTEGEQACLDTVAERFPARSREALARAKAFSRCLQRNGVDVPFQGITADLTTESREVFFEGLDIPDELLDSVDDAVTACRNAE